MKLRILSEQKSFIKKPASSDCILGQERAFLRNENVDIVYKSLVLKNINRILNKANIGPIFDSFTRKKNQDCVYFYIAMNLVYLESNKYLLKELKKNGNKVALYIYDCWEPEFDDWQKTMDEIKPDYVFFCFKQTWEHYKDIYNSYWIPQSADLDIFKPLDIEKTRKFIQIGRVNKDFHKAILEYMSNHSIEDSMDNYAYRKKDRTKLFSELDDLVREINKSKYFVSVPKCYENFKRTGNVCGITARYFEAIACKTMIIGKKPISFDELFPSDGMLEFNDDLSNFNEIIEELETNDSMYNKIVENNYKCLVEKNTWGNRLVDILEIINNK